MLHWHWRNGEDFLWRKAGAVHVSEYLLSDKLVFKVDLENISLIKL